MDSRFRSAYGQDYRVVNMNADAIGIEHFTAETSTSRRAVYCCHTFSHADARTLAHLLLRAVGDEEDPSAKAVARGTLPEETELERGLQANARDWQCSAPGCTCKDPSRMLANHYMGAPHKPNCGCPNASCVTSRESHEKARQAKACEKTGSAKGVPVAFDFNSNPPSALFGPIGEGKAQRSRAFVEAAERAERALDQRGSLSDAERSTIDRAMAVGGELLTCDDTLSDEAFLDECAMRAMEGILSRPKHEGYIHEIAIVVSDSARYAQEMLANRRRRRGLCAWPQCSAPALCESGNFGNQPVCVEHFKITNGTTAVTSDQASAG